MPTTVYSRTRAGASIAFGWALLALLTAAAQPVAGQGRPLALEDYYRVQDIRTPRISPDGDWVAYLLASRVEEDNSSRAELWVVATDGRSEPVRASHAEADASRPSWSPEGNLLYTADGMRWSVDPGAPAGPRLVEPSDDVGTASPDGRLRAGLQPMRVEQLEVERLETVRSDFEQRHEERFEGRIWDHMYFQRDRQPMPTADPTDPSEVPAREVFVLENGERRMLTDLTANVGGLVWSPDGRSLAFTADPAFRDESTYGRSDLWTVTIAGRVDRLTEHPQYTLSGPAYSPDGSLIAFVRRTATDWVIQNRMDHGGPTDLMIMPAAGGDAVNLTADWDLQPRGHRWSPDGRWLYFSAGIGGETHLFRVASGGGGIEQVTHGERRLNSLEIDERFTTMAYLVGRFEGPSELYAADIDGSNERRLTSVHDVITSEIAFSRAERITYRSYDGTPVEGWLIYPYGYDPGARSYPMVVHSHGGPHSAVGHGFSFKHQLFAANGYFVLTTNFRSSTGYGEDFLWATWGEWGTKDGQDVMSGVDHVTERFPIDPERVATFGHSYGGFMSNWLITRYPDRFAAAAVGAGISNWMSDYGTADVARTKETEFFGTPWTEEGRERLLKQSPLIYADRAKAATLFVHGEVDHRVPFEEGEQMYFALKKNGVPAEFILYDDQPHGIGGHWNNVHRMMHELRWWDTWLKAAPVSEQGATGDGEVEAEASKTNHPATGVGGAL